MDILKNLKLNTIFNKSVSIFVCAVMILSMFAASIIARADDIEVWDGTAATSFAGGSGTVDDPYLIENAQQLYYLTTEVSKASNKAFTDGKYFKITKDIYINDVSEGTPVQNLTNPKSWGNGLTAPDTGKKNYFYGTLDGDGHVIYGLYVYNYINPGLFGAIANGAVVKNLGFENLYFEGGAGSAGAVAGYANYAGLSTSKPAKIQNCYVVNGKMVAGTSNKLANAGGFIGNASNATIEISNSYVHSVEFSASTCNASMIGKKTQEATVSVYNSYFVGKFPVTSTSSGHNKVKYYNVYTDQDILAKSSTDADEVIAKLTTEQMKGEAAKTNMVGFDFENVWQTVANDYPVFKGATPKYEIWDGTKASSLSEFEGKGTASEPYKIKTGAQLAYIVSTNLDDGLYYELANDIYLNDVSKENWKETARNWVWADIRFVGTFDGKGHTIYGLFHNGSQKRMGLFSYIGDTLIKNVKFSQASITTSTSEEGAAIVAAQASAKADFDTIYIDATCSVNAPNVKGVSGIIARSNQNVNITNSIVLGTYNGKSHVGAFLGTFWGGAQSIKNSFTASNAPVTASRTPSTCENVYATVKTSDNWYDKAVTLLTEDQMKGEAAKTNMQGLDFDTIFQVVANDYPIINVREVSTEPETPVEPEIPEEPVNQVWDGTKASSLNEFEGKGTAEEPYKIKTGAQLAYVVSTNLDDGLYYELANDIYLNDVSKENWKETARNWVWADVRFVGTFDGKGHTIYGLFHNGSQKRMGLFSYIGDTLIKNVKFSQASITTTTSEEGAAIVAAQASAKADFDTIYIDATCSVNAPNVKGVSGIIARSNQNVNITNSIVLGTYNGKSHVGAFLGTFWGGAQSIKNSFTASNAPVTPSRTPTIENVYATVKTSDNYYDKAVTLLTEDQMKGNAAKTNMQGLDFDTIFQVVTNDYPIINVREKETFVIWDGTKSASLSELKGKGTAQEPYEIENGSQLAYVVSTNLDDGLYFKVVKDIYLNDTSLENWEETARNWVWADVRFVGTFDGQGHTIHGLYYNGNQKRLGLFAYIGDSLIKNVKFSNAKIISTSSEEGAAIVAAQASAKADFDMIYVDATCSVEAPNVKGVAGIIARSNQNVNITNSAVLGTFTGKSHVGSFFGTFWGGTQTVSNSFSASNVPIMTSRSFSSCENTYVNLKEGYYDRLATELTLAQMKGEAAKTNMSSFDWTNTWETVDNYYPIIKGMSPALIPEGGEVEPEPKPTYKIVDFAGGSGTSNDPYLISDADQLYSMVVKYTTATTVKGSVNSVTFFKLTNDIHLNEIDEADLVNPTTAVWGEKYKNWYQPSGESLAFAGSLDGDGFTVYGLYSDTNYAGLIPLLTDGGQVYNLNLKNSFTYGTNTAGGIVGYVPGHYTLASVGVNYCMVDNVTVYGKEYRAGALVGGIYSIKVIVSNCAVTNSSVTAASAEYPGRGSGLIGYAVDNNVKHEATNCYTDASVHPVCFATDKEGNFDRIDDKVNYSNVYTLAQKNFDADEGVTYITEAQLKGNAAKETLVGFNFEKDWKVVENGYPVLRKNAGKWIYDTTKPGEVWSGRTSKFYASGEGTKENPYIIETGGQLALLANDALNSKTIGRYYKITADIILNDTSKENWKETANEWYTGSWGKAFRGHLDGGYHVVSGLYLNKTRYNYTGTDYYGGLFANIGQGAVVEKLGIVNSSLTFTTGNAHVGAFAGFIDQYDATAAGSENYPIIRECFADTTVYLEGDTCGGFVGTVTRPVYVQNSYFTGKVANTSRGLFGYSKTNKIYEEILVKNTYVADSKYAVFSNVSYDNINYQDCYSSSAQDTLGITRLFIDRMTGAAAKEYMNTFDFENVWVIGGDGDTPGLKGFKANSYSNYMPPVKITISYETNCDILLESTIGKAYGKLELPELKREGYTFEGWYAYPELDVPFDFDYYPTFDTIVYAKWSLNGFAQDFEQYEDSMYDYHEDYEYYRPTVANYSAKYVRSGGKAIHRIGASNEELDFLVTYSDQLEVGKKYKMTFYLTTDQKNASVDLSMVYLDWPDVYSANNGVTKIASIDSIKDGEWTKVTVTFVAESKWLAIRTSGENSIYFDDFEMYYAGEKDVVNVGKPVKPDTNTNDLPQNDIQVEIEPGEDLEEIIPNEETEEEQFIESKPDNMQQIPTTTKSNNSMTIWYILIAVGSVICLGAVALVIVILVKRKKK